MQSNGDDLGAIVKSALGSLATLRQNAFRCSICLHMHSKAAPFEILHSHSVTKNGKTWNLTFSAGGSNNSTGSVHRVMCFQEVFVDAVFYFLNAHIEEVAMVPYQECLC